MTKNIVTQKDLYDAIGEFRKENNTRFDEVKKMFRDFHNEEFKPVKEKVDGFDRFRTQVVALAVFVGVIVNYVKDFFGGSKG